MGKEKEHSNMSPEARPAEEDACPAMRAGDVACYVSRTAHII